MNNLWLPLLGIIWLVCVLWLYWRSRTRPGNAGLWRDLLAGGVLFLLTLGYFWRVLSGDVYQPADGGDLVSFLFPIYRFAAGELAQGRLPLWNPTLYSGAPFIGDIQAGFFYPPNLLLFLANPTFPYQAMQWLAAGHFFWAGLGMYVLLRTLRWGEAPVARPAALFGAVAFMFCDPLLTHFGNLNLIAVSSWLPWVLAAYVRALDTFSLRWAGLAALLFAVSTYAGHAQSTAYIGVALVLYTVGRGGNSIVNGQWSIVNEKPHGPGHTLARSFGLLVFVALITALLTAPILLPALEMTRHTVRSDFTYQDSIAYSLAPTQALIGLVTPSFFGRGPALHWSLWERVELPYAGVATLILALAALLLTPNPQRRRLWPWVGIAVFGMVVALGVYGVVHGWLTLLPIFDQFRAPARALILWALGVSVLAAVGLDVIAKGRGAGRQPELSIVNCQLSIVLRSGAFVLGALAVPLAYFALLVTQADETAFLRASLAALAIVFAAVFWLVAWAIIGGYRAGWFGATAFGVLLVALLYFDLSATGAYTDISPTDPTSGFQHQAIIDFLHADPDLFRIDTNTDIDALWQPDTAALAGLQDVGGVANPLALRSAKDFWEASGGRATRRYDMLNVKYVLVKEGTPLPEGKFARAFGPSDGLEVYRNTQFVPRAWFAPANADLASLEPPAEPGGATVRHYSNDAMTVDVQAPEAGYLVLSEIWYPGWQATVDGAPAVVEQVNGTFRAVPVPAGSSTVALHFQPATFQWGLIAAAVGLVLLVVAFIWRTNRRRGKSNTDTHG